MLVGDVPGEAAAPVVTGQMEAGRVFSEIGGNGKRVGDQQVDAVFRVVGRIGARLRRVAALVGCDGSVARVAKSFHLRVPEKAGDAEAVQHEDQGAVFGAGNGDVEGQAGFGLDVLGCEHRGDETTDAVVGQLGGGLRPVPGALPVDSGMLPLSSHEVAMENRSRIALGLSMRQLGYHAGGWRHPDVPAGGAMDIDYFVNVARVAERGLFDMVFLADGVALRQRDEPPGSLCRSNQNVELEPLTLLSAVAMMTRHIGLVATASTTYNEPYHVARKFASLDHISHGRAGWNVVTSWSEAEARNFSRERHLEYDVRYDRAAEFVKVVKGLWDSWDADAFVHDKASGLFYDPAKMHTLGHKGRHFSVQGPLTVARTPQGCPVIVQAGASEQGQEIAAASADIVFVAQTELKAAQAYYASVKTRLAKYGRSMDHLKIMPGLLPIVGRTLAEAHAKHQQLQDLIHPLVGLAHVYGPMGDLSRLSDRRTGPRSHRS